MEELVSKIKTVLPRILNVNEAGNYECEEGDLEVLSSARVNGANRSEKLAADPDYAYTRLTTLDAIASTDKQNAMRFIAKHMASRNEDGEITFKSHNDLPRELRNQFLNLHISESRPVYEGQDVQSISAGASVKSFLLREQVNEDGEAYTYSSGPLEGNAIYAAETLEVYTSSVSEADQDAFAEEFAQLLDGEQSDIAS